MGRRSRAHGRPAAARARHPQRWPCSTRCGRVPRHRFVPARSERGSRTPTIRCPIGFGQTISQPYIVAFMTEALDVRRRPQGARDRHRLRATRRRCSASWRATCLHDRDRRAARRALARGRCRSSATRTSTFAPATATLGWPEEAPLRSHHRHRRARRDAAGARRAAEDRRPDCGSRRRRRADAADAAPHARRG